MAEAPMPNGRPLWPDVLAEIRASENRIRADVKEVKSDVVSNKRAIERLEIAEAQRGQATKDLFRTGNAIRTGTLLVVALLGVFLGFYNILF
jgi:hypothetical protein